MLVGFGFDVCFVDLWYYDSCCGDLLRFADGDFGGCGLIGVWFTVVDYCNSVGIY